MASTSLLGLPPELLQHAFSFVKTTDLPRLRLVCRELDDAVLDQFAAAYLTKLEAFILDAKRLQRIDNILSQPHLLSRTRLISLSSDPFEGHEDRTAPNADQSYSLRSRGARLSTFEQHFLSAPKKPKRVDWVLLRSVLRRLAATSGTSLGLELYAPHQSQQFWHHFSSLLDDVLEAAVTSLCPIVDLGFSNGYNFLGPGWVESDPELATCVTQALVALRARFNFQGPTDLSHPNTLRHLDFFRILPGMAPNLVNVSLNLQNEFRVQKSPKYVDMVPDLLGTCKLECLQELELSHTIMRVGDLVGIIERMSPSMKKLVLEYVHLTPRENPWAKVLRSLQEARNLCDLRIKRATMSDPDLRRKRLVSFWATGDGKNHESWWNDEGTAESVQAFLNNSLAPNGIASRRI